jgi:hypothetical protein
MKRVLPLIAVLLLAAGCPSPSGGPSARGAAVASAPPDVTKAPIAPCPATADAAPTTRTALGRGVEMHVLLFSTEPELRANRELKIVFRLTGGQDVTLTADGPGEKVILPVWGPEWHSGSNFDYPGAEFGVGFTFPEAGCWRIRVVNESGVGELILRIAAAATPTPSRRS